MGELDLIHLNGHWRFWLKAKQTGFFLMAVWKTLLSSPPFLFPCVHTCQKGDRCPGRAGGRAQHKQPKGLRDFLMAGGGETRQKHMFWLAEDAGAALGWQLHSKPNGDGHSSPLWSRVVSVFSAALKSIELFPNCQCGRTTEEVFSLMEDWLKTWTKRNEVKNGACRCWTCSPQN